MVEAQNDTRYLLNDIHKDMNSSAYYPEQFWTAASGKAKTAYTGLYTRVGIKGS